MPRRLSWFIIAFFAAAACLPAPPPPSPAAPLAAATSSAAPPRPTPSPAPAVASSPSPSANALPAPTAPPSPTPTPVPLVSLAAVGDVMLARQLGERLAAGEAAYPFALVAETLRSADIAVGNLECAISDRGEPLPKAYRFRAPPAAAEALRLAGFDLMTLANNHALDYGPLALADTIDLLHAAGVAHVGAGLNADAARAPALLERNGLRVAFLGYVDVPVERSGWDARSAVAAADRPGLAWAHLEDVAADVALARGQADVVVVLLHSGYEYAEQPNAVQRAVGRAAIDAGAALVLGAHSHTLQGVEYYNGGVIAYSLGNFAFEIERSRDSAILRVTLGREGVQALEWLPVVLDPADGRPAPAQGQARERILQTLARLTQALG